MAGVPGPLLRGRWWKRSHDGQDAADGSFLKVTTAGQVFHFNSRWRSWSEITVDFFRKSSFRANWGKRGHYRDPVADFWVMRNDRSQLVETTAMVGGQERGRYVVWSREVPAQPSAEADTVEVPLLRQHSSSAKRPQNSGSDDDNDAPQKKFARVKEEPDTPAAAELSSLGQADFPVAEQTEEGVLPDVPQPTRARNLKEEPQEDAPAIPEPGSPGFTCSGSIALLEQVKDEVQATEEFEEAEQVEGVEEQEEARHPRGRRPNGTERQKRNALRPLLSPDDVQDAEELEEAEQLEGVEGQEEAHARRRPNGTARQRRNALRRLPSPEPWYPEPW